MLDSDFYELLQVERSADERTIKSAYRKLAMECHPDRNPGCKVSEEKFKAISQAYECLKDPQKRAAYDRFGHAAFRNGGMGGNGGAQDFGSFSDIFENIFGEFMNGQGNGRHNVLRGSDLRYDLEITLEDAYQGKDVELRLDTTAPASLVRAPAPSRARRHAAAAPAAAAARSAPARASSWSSAPARPAAARAR
jgi:molecular chaperone DnaJ